MKQFNKDKLNTILSDIEERKTIGYDKIRVSGSNNNSYFMHSRSACMPGQSKKFNSTSLTKPGQEDPINDSRGNKAFIHEKLILENKAMDIKYSHNYLDLFTYKRFLAYDDDSLKTCIKVAYKQIYGNIQPMDSERPIDLERSLRNGDISIREFVRALAKSPFYRYHFFEKVNQKKAIELSYINLLGRPIRSNQELIISNEIIYKNGFNQHIDYLVDSKEYWQAYGENIVPYPICWNSSCNSSTIDFVNAIQYSADFASADNVLI